jgi:glycosyltransferase involved in cell wall biosynthesis
VAWQVSGPLASCHPFVRLRSILPRLAPANKLRDWQRRLAIASYVMMSHPPIGKLFVITYHFPPDGSVGGWRWAAFTKYLHRLGWECHVLTAAGPPSAAPGIIVHHCARRRTLLDWYKSRRLRPVDADAAPPVLQEYSRVRAELGAMLSLPDESRGWIMRAASQARHLIRSLRPDVVVSSGPPHSAHLVARLAASVHRGRWYADLRDPWPQRMDQAALWNTEQQTLTARLVMPRIERLAMSGVAGIIANTAPLAADLAERYSPVPVVWVRNGFDPERAPPPRRRADTRPFVVSYVGSLYGTRSLDNALEGFRRFISRAALGPQDAGFRLVGQTEEPHRSRLMQAISQRGLDDYVHLTGRVSPGDALRHLQESHVTVILAQGQPSQVPAKLYECVGLAVPVLVLAEIDSATAGEAAKLGTSVIDPENTEGIARVFERARLRGLQPQAPPAEVLYPHITRQISRLLSAHDRFCSDAVPPRTARQQAFLGNVTAARNSGHE